jgi:hypothetical protein
MTAARQFLPGGPAKNGRKGERNSTMTNIHAVDSQAGQWLRRPNDRASGEAFRIALDGPAPTDGASRRAATGTAPAGGIDPTLLRDGEAETATAAEPGRLDRAADAVGSAFGFLREVGVTITETIVLKWNSSGAYEVFANRSCSVSACYAGQEEGGLGPHPDGDLLEGILNGTLAGFEDLTRQIQGFFAEADAMVEDFISQANGMRERSGQPPLPFADALSYWQSLPNGLSIPLDALTGDDTAAA